MKKEDYQLLSKLISTALTNDFCKHDAGYVLARNTVIEIAQRFAKSAHVDKHAFLKACGVE